MWFVDHSYKCELCEKCFTQAGNLMQHISDAQRGNKSVNTWLERLVACTASDTFRTVITTSVHTAGEFYKRGQHESLSQRSS